MDSAGGEKCVDESFTGLELLLAHATQLQAENRGLLDILVLRLPKEPQLAKARARFWPLVERLVERAQQQGTLRTDLAPTDITVLIWQLGRVVDTTSACAPELWRRYLALALDGLRTQAARSLPHPPLTHREIDKAMIATAKRRGLHLTEQPTSVPTGSAVPTSVPRSKVETRMIEKEIQVRTADGTMTTFVVHPDGEGPFPVALVYMDGIGYREQVKENARRFAADGYYCAVPDLYYRSGTGLTFDMAKLAADGFKGPEAERLMSVVASVTPERVVADTEAIFAAVETDPAAGSGPKVCVGYCMGARVALRLASALPDEIVAAAGIHPGALVTDQPDSPHHDLPSVRAELYFAFAETDQSATPESIDRFRDALETSGINGTVERLPGTAHGFAMADLPVYNRDAAERHFQRTLELWRRNLSPQPVTA